MNARGVALITGLVLLAAISLLALAGTSAMILQKHMATNFKLDARALQNAELAQADARAWLYSRTHIEREMDCISDCLLPIAIHAADEFPVRPEFESNAWWNMNAVAAGMHPETGDPWSAMELTGEQASRWIIEELHFEPVSLETLSEGMEGVGYYRVLGRGTGGDAHSVAVTEAILARPWDENLEPAPFPPDGEAVDFCAQLSEISGPLPDCGMRAWRQRR